MPAMLVMLCVVAQDSPLFARCVGNPIEATGRGAGMVRALLALPCSPFLLTGRAFEWLLFVALWLPLPFALGNLAWLRRHKSHWDRIRRREAQRRGEKLRAHMPGADVSPDP